MNFNDIPCTMVEEFLCFLIFNIENFFSYSICLDAPHLTNKHSALRVKLTKNHNLEKIENDTISIETRELLQFVCHDICWC